MNVLKKAWKTGRGRVWYIALVYFLLSSPYTALPAQAAGLLSSLDCFTEGCRLDGIYGDTYIFSAWGHDGNTGYNGTTLPGAVYGTFNDGASRVCMADPVHPGGSLGVIRLSSLDLATPANTVLSEVNCMGAYGTDGSGTWGNAPFGACNAGLVDNCSWKSHGFTSVNGILYLQIFRQAGPNFFVGHDSTLIKSADGGATWTNPAHVGAPPDPVGDAPAPPGDPNYVSGMLWPDPAPYDGSGQPMARLSFVQYCQDQSIDCPNVDNNAEYVYAMSLAGNFSHFYLSRIRKIDMPRLAAGDWDYYYCPGYSADHICDGALPASWTKTLTDITPIETAYPFGNVGAIVYLKDLGQYVWVANTQGLVPFAAPHPWGPWTAGPALNPPNGSSGFPTLMLFTEQPAGPGHERIVMDADSYANPSPSFAGTVFFHALDFQGQGAVNRPPTVAAPAAANPNPTTSATTLSVLGADPDDGASTLTYTWVVEAGAPGPVTFCASNGTNAAQQCLATLSVPGVYALTAIIRDPSGAFIPATVSVTVPESLPAPDLMGLERVRIYPNPWRSDKHAGHPTIHFDGLIAGSVVKIFTVSARLVKDLAADHSKISWDLTNSSGNTVATGLYLYLITDPQGRTARGTLVVMK